MKRYGNEDGIAYAWMVITLFIILAGILIAVFYPVINSIISGPNGDNAVGINHDIQAGRLSQQGRNAAQFNIDFATNAPIMIVMSIFVFAIARAVVVKKIP